MIEPIITVLTIVAEKFFSGLINSFGEKASASLVSVFSEEPRKEAFKKALFASIEQYKTATQQSIIAEPLLRRDGPFANDEVIAELIQLVRFDRQPNLVLIGEKWRAALVPQPKDVDFTVEAQRLLDCLMLELRGTEIFSPVFNAKAIDSIALHTAQTNELLAQIAARLGDIGSGEPQVKIIQFRIPPNHHSKRLLSSLETIGSVSLIS